MSKVIFTNGCFDILHRGHIELLKYCYSLGDIVIVGFNSDDSVKSLKGINRPINSQKDRKIILESIKYVHQVIVLNENTNYNLIKDIKPDIIVKGGDYKARDVVGKDLCEVKIFNYVEGYSTTKAIQDITISLSL